MRRSWLSECHRQLAPAGRWKLARMESRAVAEVTVLAEGVDRWRNGVCSLNRPTQARPAHSPPSRHPFVHAFLSPYSRMTIGKWYRGFPRLHFGIARFRGTCFVSPPPRNRAFAHHRGATKMGWPRTGWGTADDSLPLTREGNRIAWPRSANIRRGLVGGV